MYGIEAYLRWCFSSPLSYIVAIRLRNIVFAFSESFVLPSSVSNDYLSMFFLSHEV